MGHTGKVCMVWQPYQKWLLLCLNSAVCFSSFRWIVYDSHIRSNCCCVETVLCVFPHSAFRWSVCEEWLLLCWNSAVCFFSFRLQVVSTKVGGVPEVLPPDLIYLAEPSVKGQCPKWQWGACELSSHFVPAVHDALFYTEIVKTWMHPVLGWCAKCLKSFTLCPKSFSCGSHRNC